MQQGVTRRPSKDVEKSKISFRNTENRLCNAVPYRNEIKVNEVLSVLAVP